jgi:hypothetical protein
VEPGKRKKTAKGKVSLSDIGVLRKPVEEAKARLDAARKEVQALEEKARSLLGHAKDAYRATLAPYRDACRKAGVACEFEGSRSGSVSERVSFVVEKTDQGVRVCVKGRPETDEVIPLESLKASVNRAAYRYTEKHLGPRGEIGNKGGSLSNRLRAVMG